MTPATRTVVYKFRVREPVEGADLVREQLRLAHRYRNKLTEIELARRVAVRAAMAIRPEVAQLAMQLDALQVAIDAAPKHSDEKAALVAQAKPLRVAPKAAKLAVREDATVQAAFLAADEAAKNAGKAARAACGVYWGTYLLIEQSAEQQRKGRDDPRFLPYRGEGRLGVQLQGGLRWAEALAGQDTRLRVEPVALDADRAQSSRHDPEAGVGRSQVWLRVGSNGRAPVWAVFPVTLHRAVPSDAVIKWATVSCRRLGTAWRWQVCFTVEVPAVSVVRDATRPDIAVNLGWRKVDDQDLRVGYWAASDGTHGELRVPAELRDKLQHSRAIGAIRRRLYDAYLPVVAAQCAVLRELDTAPEWFVQDTATIAQWRSPERLYRFTWRWRFNRFPGDEAAYDLTPEWITWLQAVRAWRKTGKFQGVPAPRHPEVTRVAEWAQRDRHLGDWQRHEADKVLARRECIYGEWAAELVERAGRVVLERWDMREVVQQQAAVPEGNAREPSAQRFDLAPSRLRLVIKNASQRLGREVVEVEKLRLTIRCHVCGCEEPWDTAPRVQHRCESCGEMWDQDYNNARNLLACASALVVPETSGALAEGKKVNDKAKISRSERFKVWRATKSQQPSQEVVQGGGIVEGS